MKVSVEQKTSWKEAIDAARWTVNKATAPGVPTDDWRKKILLAEHSPLRLVEYDIKFEGLPNKCVNHLVRHHIGCEKFVATHRTDRGDFNDEEVNRLTPTNLWMRVNVQGLKNISYKRLCYCAEKETREAWQLVKDIIGKTDPVMADKMVPECIRCHGNCPEFKSCGFYKTDKAKEMIKKYWNEDEREPEVQTGR